LDHANSESIIKRVHVLQNRSHIVGVNRPDSLDAHFAIIGLSKKIRGLRAAHKGVLFLDEIGELDAPLQAKSLRAPGKSVSYQ